MMRHDDFIHSFNILSYDLIATNLELTTTKPEIKKRKKREKSRCEIQSSVSLYSLLFLL